MNFFSFTHRCDVLTNLLKLISEKSEKQTKRETKNCNFKGGDGDESMLRDKWLSSKTAKMKINSNKKRRANKQKVNQLG